MGLTSQPLVLRAEAQHTLMDMSASIANVARSHLGDAVLAAWEMGCCLAATVGTIPFLQEVRLLVLAPWLHGKSWHDAGQPQEMEQMNSLHFLCCVRTPSSIPCFPQGFLPSAPETRLYHGVSTGWTVGMHSIFTTTQALHFCCCKCPLEGRREKLLPFLHPQGVWWVLFALSWPPFSLIHTVFSPQTYTSANTSPHARMGHSASMIEMGSIPAYVQKVSTGRTVR